MKAIRFYEHGGPEVLRVEDLPIPQPQQGEVLVRIEAAGVQFADTMRRRGSYPAPTSLPFLPGQQIVGIIEEVGEGVTTFSPGTIVLATLPYGGGYAQYVVLPVASTARLVVLPSGIDPVTVATLQVQGLTAYLNLKISGRLQPGESVLVHAAGGGVGTLAVQLAKLLGASRVIATASTDEKLAIARELGADVCVNYTHQDWAQQVVKANGGHGVDVILEMVGGDILTQSFACLSPFGRLVVYGNASGQPVAVNPQQLLNPCQSITGFYLTQFFAAKPDLMRESLATLLEYARDGRLRLDVGEVLPLAQAEDVHRHMDARQTIGKIVLQPWAS